MPSQPAPYGPEVRIRIGGPAGFGIKAAGQTLARVFARSGYHTFDLTEYPSLIKGGHNTYHLRISEEEIFSHVMPTDILLALDAATVGLHLGELTEGAAVVFDPKDVSAADLDLGGRDDLCLVPVPLTEIVYEVGGIKIMRNVVALGAVLGQLGFPLEGLLDSLKAQFAHKAPEVAEQNIAAATRGYEVSSAIRCSFPHRLEPREPLPFALLDGNEACGLGALAGGLGFYAAYPMTPASSLLHFMAKNADSQGVVVKHTEDEIAAINMTIGAAFGGTRSMCATSGGGFSLMVEALGFAGDQRVGDRRRAVHATGTGDRASHVDRAVRSSLRHPCIAGRVPAGGPCPRRPVRSIRSDLAGVQPRRPASDSGDHPR